MQKYCSDLSIDILEILPPFKIGLSTRILYTLCSMGIPIDKAVG